MTRNRERDLHLLATAVLKESNRLFDGEGYGWGLQDKRPFGNSGREGVAVDVLLRIGLPFDQIQGLPDEEEEVLFDYALGLYKEVADYISKAWAKLPVPTDPPPKMKYIGPLYHADPLCDHDVKEQWSGVKCVKCPGWYCL